ncbi:MAG: hypothetical protein SGPRY_009387 [Prymnesium sp.]
MDGDSNVESSLLMPVRPLARGCRGCGDPHALDDLMPDAFRIMPLWHPPSTTLFAMPYPHLHQPHTNQTTLGGLTEAERTLHDEYTYGVRVPNAIGNWVDNDNLTEEDHTHVEVLQNRLSLVAATVPQLRASGSNTSRGSADMLTDCSVSDFGDVLSEQGARESQANPQAQPESMADSPDADEQSAGALIQATSLLYES